MQLTTSILIGWILGVIARETGHLLAARIVGITVTHVTLGIGPLLGKLRLGAIPITIRLLPLGGYVQILPFLQVNKFKQLTFLSGGFIGNLILLACFILIDWPKIVPGASLRVETGLMFSQLWLIVYNLTPRSLSFDDGRIDSDGWQILTVLKLRSNELTELGQHYRESLKKYTRPGGGDAEFSAASALLLHYSIQFNSHRKDEQGQRGQLGLLREIQSGSLSPPEELLALDRLITRGLESGAKDSLPQLDEWSTRAMLLGSDFNAIRHTRGAVLVELGRYAEAKEIIVPAMRETDSEFETMLNCIFLARAEYALGNQEAAQSHSERAHKLATVYAAQYGSEVGSELLARMDAAIAAG